MLNSLSHNRTNERQQDWVDFGADAVTMTVM